MVRDILGMGEDEHATQKARKIEEFISDFYSYFYIPVEVDTATYTKLEQQQIQRLLDDDILKAVSDAIGKQTVTQINDNLRKYLEEVHSHIDSYIYKGTYRDQITIKDLTDKVFDAFFSTKVLHKKVSDSSIISVSSLSSGEKRQALIETIFSLLTRRRLRKSQLIIAIDEPDASLHSSACHDQFERVTSLSNLTEPNAQVLLTTHWYGFLPLARDGEAHSISIDKGKAVISTIDLYSYRESIKSLSRSSRGLIPADVSVKSYNDLVQSIFSATMRDDPYNWIICEGLSDRLYIEHLLGDDLTKKKIRVLPVGGYADVSRIHDRLAIPMAESEFKDKIKGKVVCLVDTDKESPNFSHSSNRNLYFKRMIYCENRGEVILIDADSTQRAPVTAIEDALDPAIFCSALKKLSESGFSQSQIAAGVLKECTPDLTAKVSHDVLDLKRRQKKEMSEVFSTGERKVDFAKMYCEVSVSGDLPKWAVQLKDLL